MRSFSSVRFRHPSLGLAVLLACGSGPVAQSTATATAHPATHPPATATHAAGAAEATGAVADPVVISVGSQQIRASQFDALIQGAPAQSQAEMLANKRAVADELGKMLALVDEAHRRGLDREPAFQAQMMLARDNALAKSIVDKLQAETTPTDAQAQAYYDAHTSDFMQSK